MKKIIQVSILFIGGLFSSCSLKEVPISDITSNNFYKSAGDAELGVNGIYSQLSFIGNATPQYLFIMGDVPTDDAVPPINNDRIQLNNFLTVPSNTLVYNTWYRFYEAINRANVAIESIPGISMEETLKNRLLGESKFLRGFYYFHLVRYFGDVPLVLASAKNSADLEAARKLPRTPLDQVYAQIINDLSEAEKLLPASYTGSSKGRATSGSAKAFLTKLYLTRKDFAKAKAKAKEIIDNRASFGYELWPTYADVFKIENKNTKEAIFDIQHYDGNNGQGNGLPTYLAIENSNAQGRGFGSFYANPDLVNSFQPGDLRKAFFVTTAVGINGQPISAPFGRAHFYKYTDPATIAFPNSRNNFPILRYADVLLMFAEASNEIDGPSPETITIVNQVRRRAYGFPLDTPNSTSDLGVTLSKESFRAAIYSERRLEFYAEGQRWLDLVRTNRLVSTIKALGGTPAANIAEKHNLFPIPQRERDINASLTQNPGYQ